MTLTLGDYAPDYDASKTATLTLEGMSGKKVNILAYGASEARTVIYGGKDGKGNRVVIDNIYNENSFLLPGTGDTNYLAAPNIDASDNTREGLRLTANAENNEIWANKAGTWINASSGNDTIHGGSGVDTYYSNYLVDNEADTIMGWGEDDIIELHNVCIRAASEASSDGADVTLTLGDYAPDYDASKTATLTLEGMSGKKVNILAYGASEARTVIYGGKDGKGNRVVVGKNETSFSLPGTGATNYLAAPNIDASDNTKAELSLTANAENNEIWANKAGTWINASSGNDTIHGGSGVDTYYSNYLVDNEADTIMGWGEDDIIELHNVCIRAASEASSDGADVTLTLGDYAPDYDASKTATLTLEGMSGKKVNILAYGASEARTVIYGGKDGKGNRVVIDESYNGSSYTLPGTSATNYLAAPNIDASDNTKAGLSLTANNENNEIWANKAGTCINASGGNDTVHGGSGVDTYYRSGLDNNEADTIMDWGEDDIIQLNGSHIRAASEASSDGADVTLTLGDAVPANNASKTATLTLKRMSGKKVNILAYGTGDVRTVIYGGADGKGNRVVVGTNETSFSLPGTNATNYLAAPNIDASTNEKNNLSIWANSEDNAIWAGSGGNKVYGYAGNDTLYGGAGNDTLYGGEGADVFDFGAGNDTVMDFVNTEDKVLYGNSFANLTSSISGSDVLLSAGTSTLLLKNAAGKVVNLVDSSGSALGTITAEGSLTFANTAIALDGTFLGSEWDASPFAGIATIDARNAAKAVKITGNSIANTIYASNKGDKIYGLDGNDTIIGGSGADSLEGGNGDDSISGGAGNDTIKGTSGANKLYGGAGADSIIGGTNNDYIEAGADNDYVSGGAGNDTIKGISGANKLYGGAGADSIIGGTNNDYIEAGADNDYVSGGNGNDTIKGISGANKLYGGAGADSIIGGTNNDYIEAGADNDYVEGGNGADTIKGISGANKLYGGAGADSIIGGTNNDYIEAGADNDYVDGGAGNDTIKGISGANKLYGGAGADSIIGGTNNDYIEAGADNDYVDGGTGNDTIKGISGANKLYGGAGADSIIGGTNNDYIEAGADNDYVDGGAGNDTIKGISGANKLYGGAGADSLIGGSNNDYIVGGKDNDILTGGAGKDTFAYATNDGNDTIKDFVSADDSIRYTAGSLTKVVISGKDALLYNGTGYQKLVDKGVKGQYANVVATDGKTTVKHNFGTNATTNGWSIDSAQIGKQGFHGSSKTDTLTITGKTAATINLGTAALYTSIDNVNASAAQAAMNITGTAGANVIQGGTGNDVLSGGAGNDTIKGTSGANKLYGGAGDDSLIGGANNDYIEAGADNDYVDGGSGNDTIKGISGANKLYGGAGADSIIGGSNNDYLVGGKDNDILTGGAGKDTFAYATNDGNDTIKDFVSADDSIRYTAGSLTKVVISGKDALLYNGTGYQKLVDKGVKGQYANVVATDGKTTVKHNFGTNAAANGWSVDSAQIGKQGFHGSSKTDTLTITGKTAATINLGTAALYTSIDNVNASAAQAAMNITGTAGANVIQGGKGNDVLSGGAGNDTIKGISGANKLYGGAGADSIIGGSNNDYLVGGKDNDILTGGAGKDTFAYATNDGNDTIKDFVSADDSIRYTAGSLTKVVISGKDALLYNGTGYQKLVDKGVKGQYANVVATDGKTTVKHNFGTNAAANGWSVDSAQIGKQGFHGSSKTDTLTITGKTAATINLGTAALYTSIDNVNASAAQAAMNITGTAGANVIQGGKGNDVLSGGAGNDTIKSTSGTNKLYGGAGADSLIGGTNNDYIEAGADNDYVDGGAGNDTIKGISGANKLYGGAGADSIIGGSNNDYLVGGKDNDILTGGAGKDTFAYATNDGNDTIKDFVSADDSIRYTAGSLTKVVISGKDALLYNGTGYQKLVGKGVKGQYANVIAKDGKTTVKHNFGTNAAVNSWSIDSAQIGKQGFHGSSKTDTLTITGKTAAAINLGTAALYTSIDNVDASKATAAITLTGTTGANSLLGGSKNDTIKGGSGNDTIKGNAGNDVLYGGDGNDKLYAQSGNNTLYGDAGADYLEGGSGTDILRGGAGNDTIKCGKGVDKIQFYKGDGKDTIQGADKNDLLYLNNISNIKSQAKFKMSGSNLVMSFTNNQNDSITLTNWSTGGMNNFVVGGTTYHLKKNGSMVSVK